MPGRPAAVPRAAPAAPPQSASPTSRGSRPLDQPPRTARPQGYPRALFRGFTTAVFLLRIILPLSFAVSLLEWLGILPKIGALLSPAMSLFRLPGETAVALVSGWLVGIYGAVATMAFLHLTPAQITVFAVIMLTAHNLVVECAVQHRTGTPWWVMLAARLATAAALGWVVAVILMPHGPPPSAIEPQAAVRAGFGAFLGHWAVGAGRLALKILLILLGLMLVTEWMRRNDLYHRLARPIRPLLLFLGLSPSVAFLWITGMVLGIAFGAGLLMDEAREPGRYRPGELHDLNVSLGLCHSLVEDTALFASVGAWVFWITIPRLVFAAIGVRVMRLFHRRLPAAPRAA